MKCEECEFLIDQYLDGELDPSAIARLEAHMAGCAGCSAIYDERGRELEVYQRYEREIEITPALWAAVEARIKQEKVVGHKSWLASLRERVAASIATPRLSFGLAAALVLVAVGITLALTTFINSRNSNNNSGTIAQKPDTNAPAPAPGPGNSGNANQDQTPSIASNNSSGSDLSGGAKQSTEPAVRRDANPAPQKQQVAVKQPLTADEVAGKLVREAEQKYIAAINILEKDVSRTRPKLDPAVRARFDVALAGIDRTITETRRAVRQNPGDPTALQYLLGAYSKKVDVLREMSRESTLDDQ